MITISVANQKGGVAKTTTSHHLAYLLAEQGVKTLLVDTDPQASLSRSCGIEDAGGKSLAEVLGGTRPGTKTVDQIVVELGNGLYLAPADIALSAVEMDLPRRLRWDNILKKSLAPLAGRFDLCLIDCPPSLGSLTIGALSASDAVLVPCQPSPVDLRGVALFVETLDLIRQDVNPGLQLIGILLTFYNPQYNSHRAALNAILEAGLPVMATRIGRSTRVAEAAGERQTILTWEPSNPRAEEYRALAEEVLEWLRNRQPA